MDKFNPRALCYFAIFYISGYLYGGMRTGLYALLFMLCWSTFLMRAVFAVAGFFKEKYDSFRYRPSFLGGKPSWMNY